MPEKCWITNETRICGLPSHATDTFEHVPQPIVPIEKSVKLGLCNGFRLWVWDSPPSKEFLDSVFKEAEFIIMDYWIGNASTGDFKRHIVNSGKSEKEFHDHNIKIFKKAAEQYGDRFFWSITAEPDSQGINFPKEQFGSKKEAHKFFIEWMKGFSSGMDPNTKLRWYDYLKENRIDLKTNNIAIQLGKASMAHYAYELGVRLVWVECNCGLPEGLQKTVAFLRGAANQFKINNTYWGIDFSTWNDRTHLSLHYDENGKRKGGLTESLYLRELMYIYLAGANLLHEEISDASHWINKPKWYSKLSPMGKIASRFGKFTKTFNRGKPYRPVAVMLEHDHGQSGLDDADTNQTWFGTVPTKNADLMIKHFFDLAFPGHDEYYSAQAKQYCKNTWNCGREYSEKIASGEDMRVFEGGRLATSRWGDIIDVIIEDCPEDVLSEYKVFILLGELKINEKLLEKLKKFVKAGGTIVANITNYFNCPESLLENTVCHGTQGAMWTIPSVRPGKVSNQIEKFTGFKFTGEKTRGSVSYCPVTKKNLFENGFVFEKIQLQTASAIATTVNWLWGGWGAPNAPYEHTPIAVENKIGKGKVVTTLPYFMMHPVHRNPLQISECIYDQVISDILPYRIDGKPIQYIFNKTETEDMIALFNNGDKSWKGCIVSKNKPINTKFDWHKDAPAKWFKEKSIWKLEVRVPKFSFKIITIKK